ncbi:hypothetical protein EI94DRAFT_1702152 [Lactarius quietus]|nr:hypothetical protein EI94DRAFT_1702152 [Lactarius quietus]
MGILRTNHNANNSQRNDYDSGPRISVLCTLANWFMATHDGLTLLKRKLDDTHLPDEVNVAGWDYSVPLGDIRPLVSRWKDGYDWRTQERELNALPAFTCAIAVEVSAI